MRSAPPCRWDSWNWNDDGAAWVSCDEVKVFALANPPDRRRLGGIRSRCRSTRNAVRRSRLINVSNSRVVETYCVLTPTRWQFVGNETERRLVRDDCGTSGSVISNTLSPVTAVHRNIPQSYLYCDTTTQASCRRVKFVGLDNAVGSLVKESRVLLYGDGIHYYTHCSFWNDFNGLDIISELKCLFCRNYKFWR